ncbi:phage tail assembly chaperone [Pseudomonas sp. zfem002]|uniref:phage tail assembly chaperone n=1 Tax=Pseudomonas sp. zfem002 TaxID=3078197 RepID=UPI002928FFF5|nr:phage tail assembly chaperone [Pseudomonas sp. zfem002]MDU9391515.1 phage tail assembly chaperone [Pseudomonas sp. zfem002]
MAASATQESNLQATGQSFDSIKDIQCKADGSFVVNFNGYPFHATENETPHVYAQILDMLEAGAPSTEFVEWQPAAADIQSAERHWRDGQIERLRWLRERHRDQLELHIETTLSSERFSELLVYLQQLRDWPQSSVFPVSEQRPVQPEWLAEYFD